MIKASGRVALILCTGFFLAIGGAAQAAPAASTDAQPDSASKSADAVTTGKHRRHAHRHSDNKTVQKSSDEKKDAQTAAGNDAPVSNAMPASVANANAQIAAADTPAAAAATAMTDRANDNVQAAADNSSAAPAPDSQVVASDQLNDVDRAVQQDNPSAQTPAVAATDAQPRQAPVMAASHSENSAWDQSTLIGKIFIGFGALLTLASAARMFMA